MEIIDDKDLRSEFTIEIKCEVIKDRYGLTYDSDKGHCGSILKANKNDIRLIHWKKYLMQVEGDDYIVVCPKCGCRIYIPEDKLPEWVRNQVKTKYILNKNGVK